MTKLTLTGTVSVLYTEHMRSVAGAQVCEGQNGVIFLPPAQTQSVDGDVTLCITEIPPAALESTWQVSNFVKQ